MGISKFLTKKFLKIYAHDELRNILKEEVSGTIKQLSAEMLGMPTHKEFKENFLFDFKNFSGDFDIEPGLPHKKSKKTTQKIKIKPIDVLCELETIPTPFSVELIDEKSSVLRDKEKLIEQKYAKREVTALIERLENRKKYTENKAFFDRFQNTTDEKIDVLLEKYALVMKNSDIFVPEFPTEAIKVMTEYTEKVKALFNVTPVFYVIAEDKDFIKKYKKRDPILLVQSPFGFFWQILGAWDKELILLSEL